MAIILHRAETEPHPFSDQATTPENQTRIKFIVHAHPFLTATIPEKGFPRPLLKMGLFSGIKQKKKQSERLAVLQQELNQTKVHLSAVQHQNQQAEFAETQYYLDIVNAHSAEIEKYTQELQTKKDALADALERLKRSDKLRVVATKRVDEQSAEIRKNAAQLHVKDRLVHQAVDREREAQRQLERSQNELVELTRILSEVRLELQEKTEMLENSRLQLNRTRNDLTTQTRNTRQASEDSALKDRQLEFLQQECAKMQARALGNGESSQSNKPSIPSLATPPQSPEPRPQSRNTEQNHNDEPSIPPTPRTPIPFRVKRHNMVTVRHRGSQRVKEPNDWPTESESK